MEEGMTHSLEPWIVKQLEVPDDAPPLATIFDQLAEIQQYYFSAEHGWFSGLIPEDAQRIVLCVNLLAGVPSDYLQTLLDTHAKLLIENNEKPT
jgi:hypothetical protein